MKPKLALLWLIAAGLALSGSVPAMAAFPGMNARIAFTSPDGTGRSVRIAAPDGTGVQTVATTTDAYVDWSPNGKLLAFRAQGPSLPDGIRITTADGTVVAEIPVTYVTDIAWSPDGQRLALVRARNSDPVPWPDIQEEPDEVWVVDVDGTALTQVTTTGNCINDPQPDACTEIETLSWSPNGDRLAYTRFDWFLDYEAEFCREPQLYCKTPQEVWFADPDVPGSDTKMPGGTVARGVDWSPDAQKLLLSNPLRMVNPDGTGLTPIGSDGFRAVWSPDGARIAYQSKDGIAGQPSWLYTRNADGTNPQLLSSASSIERDPDWQPNPRGYPRPKGATPIYASLVPAYLACTSPNRAHGAPLSFGSCAPPGAASPNLTVGTPDANGQPAAFVGGVNLGVVPGFASTPEDEADVRVDAQLTDIRTSGNLADYTGELELRLPLRITDRNNTGSGPGTVQDTVLGAAIPCAATTGTVGAACATGTTIDAVVPGAVKEIVRTIWEIGQIRVNDGGADGDADTPGNSLFAVQGVFTP